VVRNQRRKIFGSQKRSNPVKQTISHNIWLWTNSVILKINQIAWSPILKNCEVDFFFLAPVKFWKCDISDESESTSGMLGLFFYCWTLWKNMCFSALFHQNFCKWCNSASILCTISLVAKIMWIRILSDHDDTICTKQQWKNRQITNSLSVQRLWDTHWPSRWRTNIFEKTKSHSHVCVCAGCQLNNDQARLHHCFLMVKIHFVTSCDWP